MSEAGSTSKPLAHSQSRRKRALVVLTSVSAIIVGLALASSTVVAGAATPPIHDPAIHAPTRAQVARTDAPPFTTFADPRHDIVRPHDVVSGPDGNLWFTAAGNKVGRITPDRSEERRVGKECRSMWE